MSITLRFQGYAKYAIHVLTHSRHFCLTICTNEKLRNARDTLLGPEAVKNFVSLHQNFIHPQSQNCLRNPHKRTIYPAPNPCSMENHRAVQDCRIGYSHTLAPFLLLLIYTTFLGIGLLQTATSPHFFDSIKDF